jgi:hypothetical protein
MTRRCRRGAGPHNGGGAARPARSRQTESLREPRQSIVTHIQLESDRGCNAFAQNEPNLSVCLQALGFGRGIKRADFRNHGQRLKPEHVRLHMRRAAHAPLIRCHDVGLCCSFRVGRHGG